MTRLIIILDGGECEGIESTIIGFEKLEQPIFV
jgi:tRNA A37 threonylcarbamoyladenosine synthetase subunit TsaC/SUA5/YrdC